MENPIKMDDLGVPLFLETPIWEEPTESLRASDITRRWAFLNHLVDIYGIYGKCR